MDKEKYIPKYEKDGKEIPYKKPSFGTDEDDLEKIMSHITSKWEIY